MYDPTKPYNKQVIESIKSTWITPYIKVKNDVVIKIHELGFTKKKSIDIVETLLEIIKSTLENEDDVLISGFGKFCLKNKNQRRGRNPATGSDLMLRERKVVTFKCSGKLRNKINGLEYSE